MSHQTSAVSLNPNEDMQAGIIYQVLSTDLSTFGKLQLSTAAFRVDGVDQLVPKTQDKWTKCLLPQGSVKTNGSLSPLRWYMKRPFAIWKPFLKLS